MGTKRWIDQGAKLPLVSIIITNHNYRRYVRQAIDSIRSQTYANLECVIIDDCSTDGSFETITAHLEKCKDNRFRCIRLTKNLGQMGAIKAGLENTVGVFVHCLDADDFVMDDFIQTHVQAHLNTSYSAGVTASDTIQVDADGQILETTFHTLLKHRTDLPAGQVKPVLVSSLARIEGRGLLTAAFPNEKTNMSALLYIDRTMDGWFGVATSSFVFRRDVLDVIVPADTEPFQICADYYLVRFAHALTGMLVIGSAHSFFRMHRQNKFSNHGVLGGPHNPGFFTRGHSQGLDREIARHVIQNIDILQKLVGLELCLILIGKEFHGGTLYLAIRNSSTLRRAFGGGNERRFYLRYRTLGVLNDRLPFLFRTLKSIRRRLTGR